ncbi:hypothetical protein V6Z11_A05G369600 [Gossypium hirsutum]|uniref:14-3-3-like protein RA215 n=1 Tax=Gossypium hirsutum TaxID=3635 RepID=A0A1U8PPW5_GOSHI|nr:14-3-3-like protein RA215 [Gossypium hirsutum]
MVKFIGNVVSVIRTLEKNLRRGAQPFPFHLQECHWRPSCLLDDHFLHQVKRGRPWQRRLRHSHPQVHGQYQGKVVKICVEILKLFKEKLVLVAGHGDSKVFYLKMKGDYHKYLAKFKTGHDKKGIAENSLTAYKFVKVCVHFCNF